MLSNFLLDAGYGRGSLPILTAAQNAILVTQLGGERTGRWAATGEVLWKPMAKLVTLLDHQLERAPSSQVIRAVRRYEEATGLVVEAMLDDRQLEIAA